LIAPEHEGVSLPLDMDGRLDSFPRGVLVKLFEKAILQVQPDILMVMGPSFHHDHTAVYEAVIAATRPTFSISPELIYVLENPPPMYSTENAQPFSKNELKDLLSLN